MERLRMTNYELRIRSLPEGVGFPVLGEAHIGGGNGRIFREEGLDPFLPLARRGDLAEEVKDHKHEHARAVVGQEILVIIVFQVPVGMLVGLREAGGVAEHAIPKPGVVSADMTGTVESEEPAFELRGWHGKVPGDGGADRVIDALEEGEEASHAHQFGHHPDGEILVGVSVFFREVLGEGFLTPGGLDKKAFAPTDVITDLEPGEVSLVAVAEGSVGVGEFVEKLGADGDLNAFDAIEHEHPEAAVEAIALPDFVQRGAGLISVTIGKTEGMKIAREAVVADGLESADQLFKIGFETSIKEPLSLILEGQGFFLVFQ